MGQIDILGRMPKDAEISPWWDDTFYEHGTQALIDTMDLVTERHPPNRVPPFSSASGDKLGAKDCTDSV